MSAPPPILKRLFSSKLRVRALEHFFSHPGEDFYVRRLAAEIGEPVGAVARELSHLELAGVLSSRRIGNQKHFHLRKECPIFEDLRNIFLKTSGAGAALRSALERIPGLKLAFLYGSFASGEASPASDLDLILVGTTSDSELAPVVARVERALKREVNYTIYSKDGVKKRLGRPGDFVHEVFSGPRILLIGSQDDELFRTSG